MPHLTGLPRHFLLPALGWLLILGMFSLNLSARPAYSAPPKPRIYVPHLSNDLTLEQGGLFWFGQVNPTANYADVRLGYTDTGLLIYLHIFDRQLWYDESPAAADLTNWDAVTLYLSRQASGGTVPTTNDYRFVAQLSHWQDRAAYQQGYRGNGAIWVTTSLPFTTTAGYRGFINDGNDARGWVASFEIPFAGLGLAGPPTAGTTWGLGLTLHDRDDPGGAAIPNQLWPDGLNGQQPATWGEFIFDRPGFTSPLAEPGPIITLRHNLNGVTVSDAHVGGHTDCGQAFAPDYFDGWGEANYAGYNQINIQNQWDVADWPCFSKFYLTFPLDSLPSQQSVLSATLTMHQFGNSGGTPEPSFIQVLTVAEDWNEATITWNNAPPVSDYAGGAWVESLSDFPGWPGVPVEWDISRAVAEAYESGGPLRLVLYSADSAYHSGKYFSTSEVEDWNAEARPTLRLRLGQTNTFFLHVTPAVQRIEPGQSATYDLQVQTSGSFSDPVTLTIAPPGAGLLADLSPTIINPPGQAGLTLTSTHPASLSTGLIYTISATATSGAISRSASLSLVVGGEQIYLPLVWRTTANE